MRKNQRRGFFILFILTIYAYFTICTGSYNPNISQVRFTDFISFGRSDRARELNQILHDENTEVFDITDNLEVNFVSSHKGTYCFQILDENQTVITQKSDSCAIGSNKVNFVLDPLYFKVDEHYTLLLVVDIPILPGFFADFSVSTKILVIPEVTNLELEIKGDIFWSDLVEQEFLVEVNLKEEGEYIPVGRQNISFYIDSSGCTEGSPSSQLNELSELEFIGSSLTDEEGGLIFKAVRKGLPLPEFKVIAVYEGNCVWDQAQALGELNLFSNLDFAHNLFDSMMHFNDFKQDALQERYEQLLSIYKNQSSFNGSGAGFNELMWDVLESVGDPKEENNETYIEINNQTYTVDEETEEGLLQLEQDLKTKPCFKEVHDSIKARLPPLIQMQVTEGNYSDEMTFTAEITTKFKQPIKDCNVEFFVYGYTEDLPSWFENNPVVSEVHEYFWFFVYFNHDPERFNHCKCGQCKRLMNLYDRMESFFWVMRLGEASTNFDGVAQIEVPVFLPPTKYNNVVRIDFSPPVPSVTQKNFYEIFKNHTVVNREVAIIRPIEVDVRYSDFSSVIAKLEDNEGVGIPQGVEVNSSGRMLDFYLNINEVKTKIGEGLTDSLQVGTGIAEIFYTPWLVCGEYRLFIQFLGDDCYLPYNYSGFLRVHPEHVKIHCADRYIGIYSDITTVDVNITDDEGNSLPQPLDVVPSNKVIQVYYSLNSENIHIGTEIGDDEGTACFEFEPYVMPDLFPLTFSFNGDQSYYPAISNDSILEIRKEDTNVDFIEINDCNEPVELSSISMRYSDPHLIEVYLTDNDGNSIPQTKEINPPDRDVTIVIDDVVACTASIMEGGVGGTVYVPLLIPGSHIITGKWETDDYYNGNQKSISLFIAKEYSLLNVEDYTSRQGDVVELIATLTDDEGNNIAEKTINFYKNGEFLGSESTTEKGRAVLSYLIPEGEPLGSFALKVELLEDDYHLSSEDTSTLTILEKITEYTCPYCEGGGSEHILSDCHICDGSGSHEITCYFCLGSGLTAGFVNCPICDGEGWLEGDCPTCGGDGELTLPAVEWVDCGGCGGDGEIGVPCLTCGGDGEIDMGLFDVDCWCCGGDGTVGIPCLICAGFGEVPFPTTVEVDCFVCGADGKVKYPCLICGTSGLVPGLVDCYICNGDGKLDIGCPGCDGSGQIEDDITCAYCNGDGILAEGEASNVYQFNSYSVELAPLIENQGSAFNDMFEVIFGFFGLLSLITLGLSKVLILDILDSFWLSLENNPEGINDAYSSIISSQDDLLNPTKGKLEIFSEDLWPYGSFDFGFSSFLIIAVIIILIFLILYLIWRFYDKSYPNIGPIPPPIGNPSKFAILVCGGEIGGNMQDSFYNNAGTIYKSLLDTNYTDDTIVYLNVESTHSIRGKDRVDGISCQQNLKKSIEWVGTYSDSNDQILIYLINHGLGIFGAGYIQLNAWNNLWDDELADILNDANLIYDVLICIIEACYSGSFIGELSGSDRIIITSTNSHTRAWGTDIGGRFSLPFFGNLTEGDSFRDAFQDAVLDVEYWNSKRSGFEIPYIWENGQYPLLDDNGDEEGHMNVPTGGDGVDGGLADSYYL